MYANIASLSNKHSNLPLPVISGLGEMGDEGIKTTMLTVPGVRLTIREILSKYPATKDAFMTLIGLYTVTALKAGIKVEISGWRIGALKYIHQVNINQKISFYKQVIENIVEEELGLSGTLFVRQQDFLYLPSKRYGGWSEGFFGRALRRAFPGDSTIQERFRVPTNIDPAQIDKVHNTIFNEVINKTNIFPINEYNYFQANTESKLFVFRFKGKGGVDFNSIGSMEIGITYRGNVPLPDDENIDWNNPELWANLFIKLPVGRALLRAAAEKLKGGATIKANALIPPPKAQTTKVLDDSKIYYYVFNDFVFHVTDVKSGSPKIWIEYVRRQESVEIENKKKNIWRLVVMAIVIGTMAIMAASAVLPSLSNTLAGKSLTGAKSLVGSKTLSTGVITGAQQTAGMAVTTGKALIAVKPALTIAGGASTLIGAAKTVAPKILTTAIKVAPKVLEVYSKLEVQKLQVAEARRAMATGYPESDWMSPTGYNLTDQSNTLRPGAPYNIPTRPVGVIDVQSPLLYIALIGLGVIIFTSKR